MQTLIDLISLYPSVTADVMVLLTIGFATFVESF